MRKKMYEPEALLKNAIRDNDLSTITTCLVNTLQYDLIRGENDFKIVWKSIPNRMRKDIKKQKCKLDGEVRIKNKEDWTEDYFFLNIEWLRRNFNMKRIRHIKKVGKYLFSQQKVEGDGSTK